MIDERDALEPLVEQILDLWERTFSRSPLAPGDTLSLRVPGSSDLGETDVARIVEALRARGYAVSGLSGDGRLSAAGLTVSGAVRVRGRHLDGEWGLKSHGHRDNHVAWVGRRALLGWT